LQILSLDETSFMKLLRFEGLTPVERQTFTLHFAYSVIEGVLAGLIALNEFVFIKSLLGSGIQASLLFQFGTLVFILLIFFNETLSRINNRKGLLRKTAILTRVPLLLLLFFPKSPEALTGDSMAHFAFLLIFLIYYLANPIVFPSINLLLKNSYSHANFGKLFSYATTANRIVMMVTTFAYGWMLDRNPFFFVYAFPAAGILGMVSIYLLTLIPSKETISDNSSQGILHGIKSSIKSMTGVLKKNIPYRHFQTGFMFYGFGFMGSYTVIIIFFEQALGLNYSSVAFYRNAYNLLAIAMLPFFGKLVGVMDPRRFAALSFFSMFVFILSLLLTNYFNSYVDVFNIRIYHTLLIYVFFHGIFAATMALIWSIGSAYFCSPGEAATYQSIHLGLTALRSVFAPVLGVLFFQMWGFTTAFAITMAALLTGTIIMLISEKKYPLQKTEVVYENNS
jgi:hypothetical protein